MLMFLLQITDGLIGLLSLGFIHTRLSSFAAKKVSYGRMLLRVAQQQRKLA